MANGFSDKDERDFGNGEVAGNRTWTPPVYGNVKQTGSDVTISLGQQRREGETLIADGHPGAKDFYGRDRTTGQKGHAHFGPNGEEYHGSPNYK